MRRPASIGGLVLAVGAGVAAVVWVLRDRLLAPATAPATSDDTPAFGVTPPGTAVADAADDLAEIKGVGPVFKGRMAAAGISRLEQVASTPPDRLAEIAGVPEARAAEWIEEARLLGG